MNRGSSVTGTPARDVERVAVDARRSSAGLELPVIALRSRTEGPSAVVTANLHGDEAVGTAVVHRLDAVLQRTSFRGRVTLYPSCNPAGLRAVSRNNPADDVDLNRVFPGNARGGTTARLAAALWRDLAARDPALLVDVHADAPSAVPYVIVDRPVQRSVASRQVLGDRILAVAEGTGLTVLREYQDEPYVQFGLDRSLAGAVVNVLGLPAVTLEVGPRRWVDTTAVDVALGAVLGALAAVGILTEPVDAHATKVPGTWRRAPAPRARTAGLLVPAVSPGRRFVRGDVLARVVSVAGDAVEPVLATEDGVLMSWVEASWVTPGALLGTLGVVDGDRL